MIFFPEGLFATKCANRSNTKITRDRHGITKSVVTTPVTEADRKREGKSGQGGKR